MSIRSRRLLQTAAACAFVSLGFFVPRPALALDDDGKQNVFMSVISVFDFHFTHSSQDIDYRERSPIVLPPKMELAKPQSSLTRPSAWPVDPDVARRQKAASAVTGFGLWTGGVHSSSPKALTHQELQGGRVDDAAKVQEMTSTSQNCATNVCRISPNELSAQGAKFSALISDTDAHDMVVAGREPPRKYLTDPPPGYRKASQTVKATTEAPIIKHDSALDYVRGLMDKKDDDD